jgi:hypothetical protein
MEAEASQEAKKNCLGQKETAGLENIKQLKIEPRKSVDDLISSPKTYCLGFSPFEDENSRVFDALEMQALKYRSY